MNQKEFEIIIEQTKKIVLSSVRKYLDKKNFSYIDDVVQNIYFRAYKNLSNKKFLGKAKISSWLYIIAKNESIRMNNKLLKQQLIKEKIVNEKRFANNKNVNYNFMEEILKKLPEKYKKVFDLFIKNYSIKEISEKLSLNQNTVKIHIFRSKKILSIYLNKADYYE